MSKKAWLKYGIYIILLLTFILLKELVMNKLNYLYTRNWGAGNSYFLFITIPLIFNLTIGMLIGLEHFVNEIKKTGRWKINIPKLVILGIPSLFLSLAYHIMSINISFIQMTLWKVASHFENNFPVFQIIFGYAFITCLYKYQERDMG
ncbi:MAG: hypothetical protein H6Q59_3470 [Firmicutes bacterium]|nr:hypothetical protein [Bacillota bacterium]